MNIINKLTFRHLLKNKKRTVVTLLGIIISVAMVTAVFTSAISFMNYLKNTSINYDGNWTGYFQECNDKDVEILQKQDNVNTVGYLSELYDVDVDLNDDSNKNITSAVAVNKDYFDIMSITLSKGKMPQNSNEIVVSKSFLDKNKLDWKVSDKVTLSTIGYNKNSKQENKTFTVCGITDTENKRTENNGIITLIDDNTKSNNYNVYVQNKEINKGIYDEMKSNAKAIGREDIDNQNGELLMYSGVSNDDYLMTTLGGFVGIILVIIMIASVFMIYDSFAVSYQQRSKYLGMLASVGATKRQKRNSIYFEGFLLGLIGIPVGIGAGIAGMAITFKAISGIFSTTLAIPTTVKLGVHISPIVIIGTIIISALTIFVSAYIPARKASKTSPIDAIKQANTVKVKNAKKLKTSKLSQKMFGYEGALSSKNSKRNKKRTRTIVLALSMSVVLFLSVSNFSSAFTGLFKNNYGVNYDISVDVSLKDTKLLENKLNTMDKVDNYRGYNYNDINIKEKNFDDLLTEDGLKYKDEISAAFKTPSLFAMNDSAFDEYAKSIGENPKDYYTKDHNAILYNKEQLKKVDHKKSLVVSPFKNMTNKQLSASYYEFDEDGKEQEHSIDVNVKTTTTKSDVNGDFSFMPSTLLIIPVSMEQSFIQSIEEHNVVNYLISTDYHKEVFEEIDDYLSSKKIDSGRYDLVSQTESMTAINTIAQVFGYGFITLITLISIMNIINTISTSMEERRREFAMLKSVGLTPKGFNKMIYLESFGYGVIALAWGLPISFGIDILMYKVISKSFDYGYSFHWQFYLASIVAVFAVIGFALLYSMDKIKNDNIIETLKQDDI